MCASLHELGRLQAGAGRSFRFRQSQSSNWEILEMGTGADIQSSACVMVTNQVSSLGSQATGQL